MINNVLKRTPHKDGYVVVSHKNSLDKTIIMESAENKNGDYVGNIKTANMLYSKRGISPETRKDGDGVCSIGFCEKEQKWYGWSHSAIFGFGVGSKVVKGDCAYSAPDKDAAREDAIRFWSDDHHENVMADDGQLDEDGRLYFNVEWRTSKSVKNKKLRDQISGCKHYANEKFGAGEWTAKTLEDAKQMACDFAEGVG